MKKTVYFIRHGESQSNAGEKTATAAGVNLTARGIQEAFNRAAGWNETPDAIVTSAYIRTKQTAQPMAEKFPSAKREEWNIHEYTYLAAAKYDGTTNSERRPFMTEYWDRADPHHKDDAGAESFAEFVQRAKDAVEKMKNAEGPVTIAFSHGYFMNGVLMALDGRFDKVDGDTMRAFWDFHAAHPVPNTQVFRFDVEDGKVSYVPANSNVPKPRAPGFND